ncbi:TPA: carbohydrate kinase family protein [Candidatus Poribacteria bacterium]|nr:carbohydrate kinase family protein [Candidatus Poribacteria bacterium]HIB90702.1 carbohydrate kinase family protein [Candidatus Poribacteria bacterium]HIB99416.1 carbohydrate kinase family protein [Candidatus Poribacteria bacterium]HIN31093.1 carbohydrate kinase family protein [Candidatus Poribacteria bacterium]HIO08996.1 carbohydrate kinase family protein [Candidatus Poribacteria bacterium]
MLQYSPSAVVGIGMSTVDYLFIVPDLPAFGKSVRATEYLRQPGGPVSTALVTLARLGIPTCFIGKVGDDLDGQFIKEEFEKEGVDTSQLEVELGRLSRTTLVLIDQETGERCFTTHLSTCTSIGLKDTDREKITLAKILHLDDADQVSIQAAEWAKAAGVSVVFDGTWYRESLLDLLRFVDVAIVSDVLVQKWMPGMSPEIITQKLCDFGVRMAIVTLGNQGCVARWNQSTSAFSAFPVDVVDTTGAGDAFHGGFIYGLLQDWNPEKTIQFASAVAAINCRSLGGRSGLPTLETVEQFLGTFT